MKNGRCRMHGGKAGRKATHGRYTRAAVAERRELRDALRLLRELIRCQLTTVERRFTQ
jgi:hypothetical protein